jgi:hypothetical protein
MAQTACLVVNVISVIGCRKNIGSLSVIISNNVARLPFFVPLVEVNFL